MNEESLKALEEILEEALGETSKELIFILLEKKYNLKRSEVSKKPEVFRKALEDILGVWWKGCRNHGYTENYV